MIILAYLRATVPFAELERGAAAKTNPSFRPATDIDARAASYTVATLVQ